MLVISVISLVSELSLIRCLAKLSDFGQTFRLRFNWLLANHNFQSFSGISGHWAKKLGLWPFKSKKQTICKGKFSPLQVPRDRKSMTKTKYYKQNLPRKNSVLREDKDIAANLKFKISIERRIYLFRGKENWVEFIYSVGKKIGWKFPYTEIRIL